MQISDNQLFKLLEEVESINNGEEITYFEILTAAFFYKAVNFKKNISIIESGLFHRFDATNILEKNLTSIITATEWIILTGFQNERTIDKIIYENASKLLNSNIVISEQNKIL